MLMFHPHISLQGFNTSLIRDLSRHAMVSFIAPFFGQTKLEAKCNNWQEEKKRSRPDLDDASTLLSWGFMTIDFFWFNWQHYFKVFTLEYLPTLNKVFPWAKLLLHKICWYIMRYGVCPVISKPNSLLFVKASYLMLQEEGYWGSLMARLLT